jgi:hypothetical protein
MNLKNEDLLWRGSADSPVYASVGTLTAATGFLQAAYMASASTVNVTKSAFTLSNALVVLQTLVDSIIANAPVLVDGTNMFVSPEDFYKIVPAIVNEYKYNAALQSVDKIKSIQHPLYPWLNIVKVNGMRTIGSGTSLITPKDNIVAIISDESDMGFDIKYRWEDRKVWFSGRFRMGTGFVQPELVVKVA